MRLEARRGHLDEAGETEARQQALLRKLLMASADGLESSLHPSFHPAQKYPGRLPEGPIPVNGLWVVTPSRPWARRP